MVGVLRRNDVREEPHHPRIPLRGMGSWWATWNRQNIEGLPPPLRWGAILYVTSVVAFFAGIGILGQSIAESLA
jgi:hypothetical protein